MAKLIKPHASFRKFTGRIATSLNRHSRKRESSVCIDTDLFYDESEWPKFTGMARDVFLPYAMDVVRDFFLRRDDLFELCEQSRIHLGEAVNGFF
jgi:hypothetical protein